MTSIPSIRDARQGPYAQHDPQAWMRRAIKAEKECDDLRTVNHQLQEQNATYRRREAEQRNIFASSLTAGEKLTLIELLDHCQKSDVPTDTAGRKKIVLQTMSHHLGMSDESIGKHVAKFAEVGLVDKHAVKGITSDGMPTSPLFVQPDLEKIRAIRTLTRPEVKNEWGGLRCPGCGSHRVRKEITTRTICLDCGNVSVDVKVQEPKEQHESASPGGEPEPQDAASMQPEEQNEPSMPKKSAVNKQEYPPILPDDEEWEPEFAPPDASPANDDDWATIDDWADCEKPAPTAPAIFPVPDDWTGEQLLQEAAHKLLWAGKHCPVVVEMGRRPDGPKYFEPKVNGEKERFTLPAIQAHLKGERALAYKAISVDYTFLMILDTDTPAGVEAYLDALPVLVAAGLLPIIEFSPVHMAGLVKDDGSPLDSAHLILLFRGMVHMRGLLALLHRLIPDAMAHTDKIWPGHSNMRMPLAKYIRPAAPGWDLLVSGVTGNVAQAGTPSAWRMVLSHQSDHQLVPDLPPEPEKPEEPAPAPRSRPASPIGGTGDGPIPDLQVTEIIAAFNATHTLDDVHPRANKRFAYAVDRTENEPSLLYNDDGPYAGLAKDMGGEGKLYDAFELEVVLHFGGDKSAALSHWARQLRAEILVRRAKAG